MTIALYGHPFASFVWKPLIALYERGVSFTFKMIDPDHPENQARIAALSPTGQFPALIDGEKEVTQSNAVIEYLDLFHGDGAPMIPEDPRQALEARMLADVFDDYIHVQTQRIVGDALRKKEERDPRGVADAHALMDRCYAWLEPRLRGKEWAACGRIHDCRLRRRTGALLRRLGPSNCRLLPRPGGIPSAAPVPSFGRTGRRRGTTL
ncbi:glutathione S-transferase family protein [Rhizobium yanglingense]